MKKLAVISTMMLVLGLFWTCGNRNGEAMGKAQTQNAGTNEYVEMTYEERQAKLAECASCHPTEAHNEMIGPHSQAYTKLLEHRSMADTSRHFPRPYQHFVQGAFEPACATCHAASDLFHSAYSGLDTLRDLRLFTKENYQAAFKLPKARRDTNSRLTGIDCLTCHLKDDHVITTEDYQASSGDRPPCDPQPSKFFSSNANCINCHRVTNQSMSDNMHNPSVNGSMTCNGCHMEKDEAGRFTHYYYWRHDPPEKGENKLVKQVFDDIIIGRDGGTNRLLFSWTNRSSPHMFSECGEMYAELVFLDGSGVECTRIIKRLNNKKIHDRDLRACFGNDSVTGEIGLTYLPDSDISQEIFAIPCKGVVEVEIRGYDKPQYWISDSLAQKVYSKRITL